MIHEPAEAVGERERAEREPQRLRRLTRPRVTARPRLRRRPRARRQQVDERKASRSLALEEHPRLRDLHARDAHAAGPLHVHALGARVVRGQQLAVGVADPELVDGGAAAQRERERIEPGADLRLAVDVAGHPGADRQVGLRRRERHAHEPHAHVHARGIDLEGAAALEAAAARHRRGERDLGGRLDRPGEVAHLEPRAADLEARRRLDRVLDDIRAAVLEQRVADRDLRPEVAVRHALFEDGGTNIVEDSVEPAARFQVRGTRLEMRNFTWPVKTPAEVALATPMPRGGRLEGRGTLQVDPSRMDVSVRLMGGALAPAQPYLPVGARVTGNVDGEAQISARFDPFALSLRGSAAVNELGIGDANRQLLSADHARAEGVDVQWPGGVRVTRMEIAKPWVLFERETSGRFPLVDLLTPRARAAPKPRTSRDPGPREPTEPLRFSLGTLALTDGFGRFVDHATDPDFAEELSAVNLTMVGLG